MSKPLIKYQDNLLCCDCYEDRIGRRVNKEEYDLFTHTGQCVDCQRKINILKANVEIAFENNTDVNVFVSLTVCFGIDLPNGKLYFRQNNNIEQSSEKYFVECLRKYGVTIAEVYNKDVFWYYAIRITSYNYNCLQRFFESDLLDKVIENIILQ